jgi:hypothetical protein
MLIVNETALWDGLTFHKIGFAISALFALIAILVSFFLILCHGTNYTKPNEQRQ